jgi:hypothetical protein
MPAELKILATPVSWLTNAKRRLAGWRPIKDAPKDRRRVHVMYADGDTKTDVWHDGYWVDKNDYVCELRVIDGREVIVQPTHFRPMPKGTPTGLTHPSTW